MDDNPTYRPLSTRPEQDYFRIASSVRIHNRRRWIARCTPALARFFGTIFTSREWPASSGGLSPKKAKWLIANGR